ncbi:MAG: hypothetical protein HYV36_06895 [Lentisphaerae bacterium]|nr:hypothetical protein [Lentisphaerota bacterium]
MKLSKINSINRRGRKACPSSARVGRAVLARLAATMAAVCFCILLNSAAAEVIVESTTWTKYNNVIPTTSDVSSTDGRIPLGTGGRGDQTHSGDATVIKAGNTYKMWHGGHDGTNYRLYHASSVPPPGMIFSSW